MNRFGAFFPRLPAPEKREKLEGTLFRPQSGQVMGTTSPNHLAQIQEIEQEWYRVIRPATVLERTYCTQLAQATWHLRCLNEVERATIAESVMKRSFNGESALRVMEWRRSTEASIQTALEQVARLRQGSGGSELTALASALTRDSVAQLHAAAR